MSVEKKIYRYEEVAFRLDRRADGWYHSIEEAPWAGPFTTKRDAKSDVAERIDLANS